MKIKPCPFCGNPAELVEAEPFDWLPSEKTYRIRCSNICCIGATIDLRDFDHENLIAEWNIRRRRNKLTCDENGRPKYHGDEMKKY